MSGDSKVFNPRETGKQFTKLLLFIAFVVAGGLSSSVQAQIDIDFKLEKDTFVTHEPVVGQLTIINRAGRDLVLAGKNGQSWLDFRVVDSSGRMITPMANALPPKPIILNPGQTYRTNVVVNQTYPMGKNGIYRIKPTVSLSEINRVFTLPRNISVNIVDGQETWSQVYGVPPGQEGAGTFREYALLSQHYGNRKKSLYIRVTDVSTGLVRKTYPLGDYMGVRPPEQIVDKGNNLHVFHMIGPKQFVYTIIGPDGLVIDQQVYVVKGSSVPNMVQRNGEIAVVGGVTLEESQKTYEDREFRLATERPPGMPGL